MNTRRGAPPIWCVSSTLSCKRTHLLLHKTDDLQIPYVVQTCSMRKETQKKSDSGKEEKRALIYLNNSISHVTFMKIPHRCSFQSLKTESEKREYNDGHSEVREEKPSRKLNWCDYVAFLSEMVKAAKARKHQQQKNHKLKAH